MSDITVEQLKVLIDFIEARAVGVVHTSVGLEGEDEAWSSSVDMEKELYKIFGFDYFKENEYA